MCDTSWPSRNIKHRFGGQHSLGGERNDRDALRRWFERLGICASGLHLTVRNVWVKGKHSLRFSMFGITCLLLGWPSDTTVFIRWTATDSFPDGSPYTNHGVHIIKLKWFKVTGQLTSSFARQQDSRSVLEIDANEDSQAVATFLKARAASGIAEAEAPQIVS